MLNILEKKRDGLALTREEIYLFIEKLTGGAVPDYQASALLMAMFIRGLTKEETFHLTMAMAHSGHTCDLSPLPGKTVDKHSTGGVADTVSLVLGPVLAEAGVYMAKMSGRGLGHTGGTVDKLESIPGVSLNFDEDTLLRIARETGFCIGGQSKNLAPADKILYALRDVTATVPSIPLIAASIMSKKLAAGADCIILDVKCGTGAFMKTEKEARELAAEMLSIGKAAGKQVRAVITEMNRPLGRAVGNALEVSEAVSVLRGQRKGALLETVLLLGENLLEMASGSPAKESRAKLENAIAGGGALARFQAYIGQVGGGNVCQNPDILPRAKYIKEYNAPESGFISFKNTEEIGKAAMLLGAGRARKEDAIDPAAGILFLQEGYAEKGAPLFRLHTAQEGRLSESAQQVLGNMVFTKEKPTETPPIVLLA